MSSGPDPDSHERLSHSDLIVAMRDLRSAFVQLQSKHEELSGALAKLRIEHQAVEDELARYEKLPPRPPQKPSGMEKATDPSAKSCGRWRSDSRGSAPRTRRF